MLEDEAKLVVSSEIRNLRNTLQETNISHLENRKIIFKHTLSCRYLSSQVGIGYMFHLKPKKKTMRKTTMNMTSFWCCGFFLLCVFPLLGFTCGETKKRSTADLEMYGHFRFKRVMVRWLNQFSLNLFGMKKSNETPEFRQDVIETLGKVGHNGTRKYLSRWWNFKYFSFSQSWGSIGANCHSKNSTSRHCSVFPWVRTWVPCCLRFKWILQGLPIISKMFESRIFWMCECHKQTTSKIHMYPFVLFSCCDFCIQARYECTFCVLNERLMSYTPVI